MPLDYSVSMSTQSRRDLEVGWKWLSARQQPESQQSLRLLQSPELFHAGLVQSVSSPCTAAAGPSSVQTRL